LGIHNWSSIDPAIMGTLFERGLDPDKRSQLGAHYTDREKIMLIVNPVIVEPLTREWEEKKAKITDLIERAEADVAKTTAEASQFKELEEEIKEVHKRVRDLPQLKFFSRNSLAKASSKHRSR
jgi:hypothetical protein